MPQFLPPTSSVQKEGGKEKKRERKEEPFVSFLSPATADKGRGEKGGKGKKRK